MKPINVGLLGIGTVGGGTWEVLARNADEIQRRAGRAIRITRVADKDVKKARQLAKRKAAVTPDAFEVVRAPDVEIVVELIGGYTTAKELVLEAIRNGKHVVTANKALLATHGNEIFAAAQKKGVMVAFEAAVAGGVPIIKALREGLTANRIEWIAGIINGTSNFILSEMRDKGLPFDMVLAEAQRLGYAEADPRFDVDGRDAAQKLAILASVTWGRWRPESDVATSGITGQKVAPGETVRLVAEATRDSLTVSPQPLDAADPLARTAGIENVLEITVADAGVFSVSGPGAGGRVTAGAVYADLARLVAGERPILFGRG